MAQSFVFLCVFLLLIALASYCNAATCLWSVCKTANCSSVANSYLGGLPCGSTNNGGYGIDMPVSGGGPFPLYLVATSGLSCANPTYTVSNPPKGMTLYSNGSVGGNLNGNPGFQTFNVTATCGAVSCLSPFYLQVVSGQPTGGCSTMTLSSPVLPCATRNVAYGGYSSIQFSVSGGVGAYTWNLCSGSAALPAGLSFSSSTNRSTISGTPTSAGTTNGILVCVTDGQTSAATTPLTIVVTDTLSLSVSPAAPFCFSSSAFTFSTVVASAPSSTLPYTYSISSGSLPASLKFNTTTGVVTGSLGSYRLRTDLFRNLCN
jgi:large repetitive protein